MKTKVIGIAAIVIVACLALLSTCGLKLKEDIGEKEEKGHSLLFTSPPLPDSVSFMGENVPLERFEVHESLDREMLVNTYFHSQTIRFIKLTPRYFSIIDPIIKEEGLPADFRYLAVAESNLDPRAYSPSGAVGLWQFMKSTATDYGLEVTNEIDERYNIEKSTGAACRYLKFAYSKYRDWCLVAAAYNAGFASVDRQLERQKVTDYFDLLMNEETERYVFRIISLKIILENPEKYSFQVSDEEKYPLLKTRKVEISGPIPDFADYAKSLGITYKMLKYYNPWLRDNLLTNKTGKTYILQIPE